MKKTDFKFSKSTPVEKSNHQYFEVGGAGQIRLSQHPRSLCGQSAGFSFGVSWSSHPFTGGVLGIDEAKKLANHILDECAKIEKNESALRTRLWKEYEENVFKI